MQRNARVERYYDANTRRFLRFGGGRTSGAIHRVLRAPRIADPGRAEDPLNEIVVAAIGAEPLTAPAVLDLGCGVGGTLLALAERLPGLTAVGVTISGAQVRIASAAASARGFDDRCRFVKADFETVRLGAAFDVAIAIEAFVHSAEPAAFFATAAAHLKPGGLLIVVDDFLAPDAESPRVEPLAERFRRGWRAPGFTSIADCTAGAEAAGFGAAGERDLTPLIRLGRPRDRLIAVVAPVLDRLGLAERPGCANLIGGHALSRGLAAGCFTYRWLAFRREPESG